MLSLQAFAIRYETPANVPPPFSYYFELTGKRTPEGLEVDFKREYHYREDLTAEEIEDEGADPEAIFSWQGQLPPLWAEELAELSAETNLAEEPVVWPEVGQVSLRLTGADGNPWEGFPATPQPWERVLQELMQAILEAAEREAPLQVGFCRRTATALTLQIEVEARFLPRTVTVEVQAPAKNSRHSIRWPQLWGLLDAIYKINVDPEEAWEDMPTQAGAFLQPGDGLWYPLPESKANQLEKRFEAFTR